MSHVAESSPPSLPGAVTQQILVAQPDSSSYSPLATGLMTTGVVIVAVVAAVAVVYGIVKATWKKKKAVIAANEATQVGVLPSRRLQRSASFVRQVSVLPPEQQLYEGLTPQKRELLEKIRQTHTKSGSAGFASRRSRSLAPLPSSSDELDSPGSAEFLCNDRIEHPEHQIAEIRRHSCITTPQSIGAISIGSGGGYIRMDQIDETEHEQH